MDAVEYYLHQILAPRLRNYGVSERFFLETIGVVHTQMTSLLRNWDDRMFRNTVLLLGLEEGSFYEPACKTDIRCFVVVTMRNSPFETLQSDTFAEAGMQSALSNQDVRQTTAEAVRYFAGQDFDALCRQAKSSEKQDFYRDLAQTHPASWAALRQLAAMKAKTADYPKVDAEAPYMLPGLDGAAEDGAGPRGKMIVGCFDGYSPVLEPPLAAYLKNLAGKAGAFFFADSLKSVTRNAGKLLDILEFLLSRDRAFVSANYYLENGHVERRAKLLRAGHNVGESRKNLANMAGLGYRHKAALNRYQKQDDMAE